MLKKRVEHVQGCRVIKKKDMVHNDTMPKTIKVDPETFVSAPYISSFLSVFPLRNFSLCILLTTSSHFPGGFPGRKQCRRTV
jgi:urease alpha subunit